MTYIQVNTEELLKGLNASVLVEELRRRGLEVPDKEAQNRREQIERQEAEEARLSEWYESDQFNEWVNRATVILPSQIKPEQPVALKVDYLCPTYGMNSKYQVSIKDVEDWGFSDLSVLAATKPLLTKEAKDSWTALVKEVSAAAKKNKFEVRDAIYQLFEAATEY